MSVEAGGKRGEKMESRGGREEKRKRECRCAEGKGRGHEERGDAEGGHFYPCPRQPRGIPRRGKGEARTAGSCRPERGAASRSRVRARIPSVSAGWGRCPRLGCGPGRRGSPPPSPRRPRCEGRAVGTEGVCGGGSARS